MREGEKIELALAVDFRLGAIVVHPALRQLTREDGAEEVLEPRVMQVLVALAQAQGGILTREQLTERCWDGRVVGDDAINRVISRLRRAAEGIGQGSFRIETLTKTGYRLVEAGDATKSGPAAAWEARKLNRRALLAGAGVAGAAALGAGGWWLQYHNHAEPGPPASVAPLIDQAKAALRQGTVDSLSQAIGLFRRVTEIEPGYADGWGLLANVYAAGSRSGPPQFENAMRARAAGAIDRALRLDSANGYARMARISLAPVIGNWLDIERQVTEILATRPTNEFAWSALTGIYSSVGRCREAADLIVERWKHAPPDPGLAYTRSVLLWSANRLDEADKAMAEAWALFPGHYAVWFSRVYLLMYTGRAREALDQLEATETRPAGIPDWNFDMVTAVARAMLSRAPADIDAAVALNVEGAHRGSGFAENTIQFASALGRVEAAFLVSGAYYFGRGFETGAFKYAPEQRSYARRYARQTQQLFRPSTEVMRRDARFELLVEELGLKRYWADRGIKPDYLG